MAIIKQDFGEIGGGDVAPIYVGMYENNVSNITLDNAVSRIDVVANSPNGTWDTVKNYENVLKASVHKGETANFTVGSASCTISLAGDGKSFSFTRSTIQGTVNMYMYA